MIFTFALAFVLAINGIQLCGPSDGAGQDTVCPTSIAALESRATREYILSTKLTGSRADIRALAAARLFFAAYAIRLHDGQLNAGAFDIATARELALHLKNSKTADAQTRAAAQALLDEITYPQKAPYE